MLVKLDITKNFNIVVDWSGSDGLNTYIDINLNNDMCKNFQFTLENFVLNLDDELLANFRSACNKNLVEDLSEEGYLIIHKAIFSISNIKGAEGLLRRLEDNIFKDEFYMLWDYDIESGDKIYEFNGLLKNLPNIFLNIKMIATNPKFILECNDFEYVKNYKDFKERVKILNASSSYVSDKKGKLFDLDFINNNISYTNYGEIIVD